nr:glycosyltransferase family 2 protein [uncultured Campylobacter sp.]
MNEELVSVIMPSYNSENFIEQSIKSVQEQTYPYWELIIVDDCSQDNSAKIIKGIAKQDSRIKFIKLKTNSGAAVARNTAIKIASGRYIAFLDSDDLWLKDKLNLQIEFMKKNGLSFTYGSYRLMDEFNNDMGCFITKGEITYNSMLKTCSVGCLTAIYDVSQLGKIYMPNADKREDYATWLKILKKIKVTKGCLEPLAIYRRHRKSVSANKIKIAFYQWRFYRDIEKLSWFKSVYYFMNYMFYGLIKYK